MLKLYVIAMAINKQKEMQHEEDRSVRAFCSGTRDT